EGAVPPGAQITAATYTSAQVSGATNPAAPDPIVITTMIPHGYESGDSVQIDGVNGNTNANGAWIITDPSFTVLDATNASPIVITSEAQDFVTGQTVVIVGVLGNTNANGKWVVTVINQTQFSLDTSMGNGAYGGGG